MLSSRRIARAPWVQKTVGVLDAEYLRLVHLTSSLVTEPGDIYERAGPDLPIILAMWHGQHFMAPFIKKEGYRAKTLISRHRDGEMNAIAAEWLGVETIRGSGDHGGEFHRKGGVGAYRQMLQALDEGYNVALTADVPKISRVAGPGIVRLARDSGRPIYPVAIASSRRIMARLTRTPPATPRPRVMPKPQPRADSSRRWKAWSSDRSRPTSSL